MVYCECGCGKEVNTGKRFIKGHQNRGRKHSEESKKKISNSQTGKKRSEEIKKKMSESRTGNEHYFFRKHHSEESKKKISEGNKGKIRTEEMKKEMSRTRKGRKHSEKTKKKMSEQRLGRKHSEETKKNISKSQIGRKHSEETKNKIGEAGKGRKCSDESKKKIGKAHKGKITSEETKKKLSKAMKGKYTGEDSPNWQGGISFEPYCPKFNNIIKEEVRNQYDRKCFLCGKKEIDNNQKLCVHHIDYNKEQGCENYEWKLIPLCKSCHIKTNTNREYWQNKFIDMLEQQIIIDHPLP